MRSRRGPAGMLMFCKCVCTWQPVQVVHGDGRVRSLAHPITVGELLECHPHHFVCEPSSDGPLYHTGMLPSEMELEEGRIYLLLPLPRLLPHLANTFPKPPSCPCFSKRETRTVAPHSSSSSSSPDIAPARQKNDACGGDDDDKKQGKQQQRQRQGTFFKDKSRFKKWLANNHRHLVAAATSASKLHHRARSKFVRSLIYTSKRLLPERLQIPLIISLDKLEEQANMKNSATAKTQVSMQCSRNRWRPGLECISEVDLLAGLLIKEDGPGGMMLTDRLG